MNAPPERSGKIRVLVVDDHALMRESLVALLRQARDFDVVGEAGAGSEAAASVQRHQPDIVLLDVRLPGGEAFEAVRRIKAVRPPTQVIILTTEGDGDAVLRACEAGASGYLLQDTRGTELVQAIRTIHGGEPLLHPAVGWKLVERVSRLSRRSGVAALDGLTPREHEILRLLASRHSNREIAAALLISYNTLKTHIRHIQQKLNTQDRVETVAHALRQRLID